MSFYEPQVRDLITRVLKHFEPRLASIQAWSDTDNYGFTIYKSGGEYDFGTTNDVRVDAVSCATDGDGCFYSEITSGFDSETLEDGRSIIFEHTTGNAGWVRVRISGTY